MPNCFQLYRKGETEPLKLQTVDEELCAVLGEPVHPKFWVGGWYDAIGFAIACCEGCGLGTQKLRDKIATWCDDANSEYQQRLIRILSIMEERYTSDAWVQVGK